MLYSGSLGYQPGTQPFVMQPAGLAVHEPATQMRTVSNKQPQLVGHRDVIGCTLMIIIMTCHNPDTVEWPRNSTHQLQKKGQKEEGKEG